jgi:hypothetical protein
LTHEVAERLIEKLPLMRFVFDENRIGDGVDDSLKKAEVYLRGRELILLVRCVLDRRR